MVALTRWGGSGAYFDKNKLAKANFEKLAPSKKKEMVRSINDAKTEETKTRRIEKVMDALK